MGSLGVCPRAIVAPVLALTFSSLTFQPYPPGGPGHLIPGAEGNHLRAISSGPGVPGGGLEARGVLASGPTAVSFRLEATGEAGMCKVARHPSGEEGG